MLGFIVEGLTLYFKQGIGVGVETGSQTPGVVCQAISRQCGLGSLLMPEGSGKMHLIERKGGYVMPVKRRPTQSVHVGDVDLGSQHPIAVQSMITEDTADIDGCVKAIMALHDAGCELVRVTTPNLHQVECLGQIKRTLKTKGYGHVPLVADIHHNGWKVACTVAPFVSKIRLNPGLFVHRSRGHREAFTAREIEEERERIAEHLSRVIAVCREWGTAVRVGVNSGSLSERMMFLHGDTSEGMVESALEFIDFFEAEGFEQLVVSLKASRPDVMIEANRLLFRRYDERGKAYPVHLGVTEAGDGMYGRIKSTAGLAPLLADGIGDTIRVSLAEDPIHEIPVCFDILQALGLRISKVEFIACPSCGRTKFNLTKVVPRVREATQHLKGLHIAVMGCMVNGPGEMAGADYGYVGQGVGRVSLYRGKEQVRSGIPEEEGIKALVDLIKQDGVWVDPD